jgi:AcrR family transcriptional regulator
MTIPRPRAVRSMRDHIIDVAVALTTESGWSSASITRVAQRANVVRQTIYNEFGSREGLGEAMIMREVEHFLLGVQREFVAHSDDLLEAIRGTVLSTLVRARENVLLHAIIGSTHGADTELLPFFSTHDVLIDMAKAVVIDQVRAYRLPIDEDRLILMVDLVVRYVISNIMVPGLPPEQIADGVTMVVERVLIVTLADLPLSE